MALPTLLDSILQNPLNIILLLIFLYLLVPIIAPTSIARLTPTVKAARGLTESYSYLPTDHPKSTEWRKYTPRSLAIYDGTDGEANSEAIRQAGGTGVTPTSGDVNKGKILLCINRKVFDVTSGGRFYGPGGPYGNFAGRDASRGMAKQSFDQEMLTPLDKPIDSLSDLTQIERTNMKEWDAHFSSKYPVVGELVENGQ